MSKKVKHSKRATKKPSGNSVQDQLASMAPGWKETDSRTGAARFPAGRNYEGIIQNVVIETNKKGNLQVHWTIAGTSDELLKGDGSSMLDHKWSNMTTEDNRAWLRGEMESLDLVWPDTPQALGDSLDDAVGAPILFDVVDSKTDEFDNHNIYFRERLEGGGDPAAPETEPDPDAYTEAEIRNMTEDEICELARDNDLDPDNFEWDELYTKMVELLV
jgi:hypothetical protein